MTYRHFDLKPEDMDPLHTDWVSDDAIVRYIRETIGDPARSVTFNLDGDWFALGPDSTWGHWCVDGPTIDITIELDEEGDSAP